LILKEILIKKMDKFKQFKKFLEQEILPKLSDLEWTEKDSIRNQIRYKRDLKGLKKLVDELKEKDIDLFSFEDYANAFEELIKTNQKEQAIEYSEVKVVFPSGKLNEDVFFNTIFLREDNEFKPKVCLNNGDILDVEEREINRDLEQYFILGRTKYKLISEIFFGDNYRINHIDNEVVQLIRDKFSNKDIYDELINKIKEFWDHFNQYECDVISSFIIHTPILRLLGKTFYLILNGKEDTGKSTLQKVITKLQFNGIFGGKGSIPVNVRLISCLGVNLNQDEFEKLSREEKANLGGVFNSGLYADGTYSFVNTNKRRIKEQITILHTFGAKSFSSNSLHGFDKSFLSRTYELICVKQNRKLKDIYDLNNEDIKEFQELTNKIFTYCLINAFDIKRDINAVKKELEAENIFGRKTDTNSIILGIIKHFKGDYYLEVKEHLKQKEGISEEENAGTYESIIFEYLNNKFLQEQKILEINNKEILNHLCEELEIDIKDEKAPKGKTIGTILKNYSLIRKPENLKRKSKGVCYFLNKSDFLDMLKRFGYTKLLDKHTTFSTYDSFDTPKNEPSEPNEENEGGFSNNKKQNQEVEQLPENPDVEEIKL